MPILYFSLGIRSSQDVPSFKVVVLRSPEDVGKRCFVLTGDREGTILLLCVEDLHCTILTC